MDHYRKLLISATNELLKRKLISPPESLNGITDQNESNSGHVFLNIFDEPSVVIWDDHGNQELRISVWWKYRDSNAILHTKQSFRGTLPKSKPAQYRRLLGVAVTGWLVRNNGFYLQGKGRKGLIDIYTRSLDRDDLSRLPDVEPIGYKSEA
ncbi:MAG TPA: hypothetical protein VK151_08540 [Fluviicola sp.]|nr:hypothetical protein [Fluviicola sp.]